MNAIPPLFGSAPARTPSSFHNDKWQVARKHPNHDRLQMDVLAHLRTRPIAGVRPMDIVVREVEGEYPIVRRGQVIGYADAIESLPVNGVRVVSLFELTPVIETVFGIVRQAKALLQLAVTSIEADQHYCHVVVPAGDPLLAGLRAEWPHTWAWGATVQEQPHD